MQVAERFLRLVGETESLLYPPPRPQPVEAICPPRRLAALQRNFDTLWPQCVAPCLRPALRWSVAWLCAVFRARRLPHPTTLGGWLSAADGDAVVSRLARTVVAVHTGRVAQRSRVRGKERFQLLDWRSKARLAALRGEFLRGAGVQPAAPHLERRRRLIRSLTWWQRLARLAPRRQLTRRARRRHAVYRKSGARLRGCHANTRKHLRALLAQPRPRPALAARFHRVRRIWMFPRLPMGHARVCRAVAAGAGADSALI